MHLKIYNSGKGVTGDFACILLTVMVTVAQGCPDAACLMTLYRLTIFVVTPL